jgi:hypothetical protein
VADPAQDAVEAGIRDYVNETHKISESTMRYTAEEESETGALVP